MEEEHNKLLLCPRRVWDVEKYARYDSESGSTLLSCPESGKWKYLDSQKGHIRLVLLESNHLVVSRGDHILESFALWGAHNWIKAIAKGDSFLFIYRCHDGNRRFRVKLAPLQSSAATLDSCKELISTLSSLIPVHDLSSSTGSSPFDSQPCDDELSEQSRDQVGATVAASEFTEQIKSTNELGRDILLGKPLQRAYADTHLPTNQLGNFIRLCLTDSNFPSFVEAVEKELNDI